tara:strand:+ start:30 stop:170 length:141 start_codon:yes stop_codon:yes gene_type:complete
LGRFLKKGLGMPAGKGTYGSKVGRPKKKKNKNGSTARRKAKRVKRK